jgi:hypothetical protein
MSPSEIKKFLGKNENVDGNYGLKLGEASKMVNFRISPNNQMKKREGYKTLFSALIGDVMGMWYGKLNNVNFFLFANNGHLWSGNLATGAKTDLGTLTDAPTRFQSFGTKVYLWNGFEYKSFDGTTFAVVAGYRPKVYINAPPDGGGTAYELNNDLTGVKHMTFSPDGVKTAFFLAENNITSLDFVYINGVLKVITTDYTVDLVLGKVTFTVAPLTGVPGSVDIGWTKGLGNRASVEKCRFVMDYSGQTDSRLFIWGDTANKNRRRWTGLANGIPSAEYFESTSFDDPGNGQYAITGIEKQYDRQKICFENGVMFSYYSSTPVVGGLDVVNFPVFELNDEIGNVAQAQTQIINNKMMTIFNGIHEWANTTVRDQTNEKLMSQRTQDSLISQDLTQAITYNWKEMSEYWLCVGSKVWVWNYLNDTFYDFDNIPAKNFITISGQMYFGKTGSIEKFDTALRNDNGIAILAVWEMGFYDFEAEWLNKYMNNVWVSVKPDPKVRLDINSVTNNEGTGVLQSVFYNLATFVHADFAHWSFLTSYNPQPFYLELQAMGFTYFRLILSNSSLNENCTVLSINMPARRGGRVT